MRISDWSSDVCSSDLPRVKVGVDCGSSTARWPLPGGTMTDTAERSATSTDAVAEVRAWLEENWDPDLTVAEWWERLGLAGWAAPGLPENAYGRGLNRSDSVAVQSAIAEFGALGAPGGLGLDRKSTRLNSSH